MCKVGSGYSYTLRNYDLLKITKNQEKARQGKARKNKTICVGKTRRFPLVSKDIVFDATSP